MTLPAVAWGQVNKVLRGGGWNNNEENVRAANRNNNTPDNRNNNIGFRCVVEPGVDFSKARYFGFTDAGLVPREIMPDLFPVGRHWRSNQR
jgi:hypothetical protein